MELVEPGELNTNRVAAAAALAFAALQAVQQAAPEYRRCALAMLGQAEEAEAEARRAYATEQNRRWFRANPVGVESVTAATKATDAARETHRPVPPGHAAGAAARADREGPAARARRPAPRWRRGRGGDRMATEPSGVDLAGQSLAAAGEQAKKNRGHRKQKPKRRTGQAVRRDGREALGLGTAITMMMTERGMVAPAAGGGVLARFDDILAAAAPRR
ncbi:hypothetical protein [Streptomyces violaceusniger]|uniref:hypothetical protein n=1 Tax=Streptomyces violaceusniger TaxID=68280 RepID=UPI0001E4E9AE|nr:hypothetical protein [Streptomyces violaceusniger]